ncbi:MAG: DUF4276 family protein [Anaerolineae bacterium]
MTAIRIGYSLEGPFDYRVVPILLRRLAEETLGETVTVEQLPPPPGRLRRGHGLIASLPADAEVLRELEAEIIVAIVDTDNTRVMECLTTLRDARDRVQPSPLCFALGVAVRSIEAWLLADEQAIRAALIDDTYGDQAVPRQPAPETLPDPKTHLNNLISDLTDGIEPGVDPFAEAIAEHIDLQALRDRCPRFDGLATEFVNCVRRVLRIRQIDV